MSGVSGKRVLVTGGTRGIGRATALALARAGARVAVVSRGGGEEADSLAKELDAIGGGHRLFQADVTDSAQVGDLAGQLAEAFGGLDVLVNNVGVDSQFWFGDLHEDEWHRVMDANVTSVFLVTQALVGQLTDGGSVVIIGSAAGLRGRARGVHYTASKAALVGFTRALSKEVGDRGIRVNTVAPGLTETEPGAGLPPEAVTRIVGMTALGRICTPEDVAGAVLFLAGDDSRYITGQTLNVDGGV